MRKPIGVPLTFIGVFIANKVGATGLTVTADVYQNGVEIVTNATAPDIVEHGDGMYAYTLDDAEVDQYGEYVCVFKTTDSSVDQQNVYSEYIVEPQLAAAGVIVATNNDKSGYGLANSAIDTGTFTSNAIDLIQANVLTAIGTVLQALTGRRWMPPIIIGANEEQTLRFEWRVGGVVTTALDPVPKVDIQAFNGTLVLSAEDLDVQGGSTGFYIHDFVQSSADLYVVKAYTTDPDVLEADRVIYQYVMVEPSWVSTIGTRASSTQATNIRNDTIDLLAKIGAFSGTDTNNVFGFLQAMYRDDLVAPSDLGGDVDPALHSLQAIAEAEGGGGPTVEEIVDGVWDAASGEHLIEGSTGEKLSQAGAAGDPLASEVPGDYEVDTAGYNLGLIPAIKAKTDLINIEAILIVSGYNVTTADVVIYYRDDYGPNNARQIIIPVSDANIDLTNAEDGSIQFSVKRKLYPSGTDPLFTVTGDAQDAENGRFTLTRTETALTPPIGGGQLVYLWDARCRIGGEDVTFGSGDFVVRDSVTPPIS